MGEGRDKAASSVDGSDRRRFLGSVSGVAMAAGLAGGYGGFALIAGRFLYPARPADRQWQFVIKAERMDIGDSRLYQGPSGETINITRQERNDKSTDFIALSSTCPHLGCQVHWEAHNSRYFCPCHNGVFDRGGIGTGGPPGDAGQSLGRYPLKLDSGLLFIEVPVAELASGSEGGGDVIDEPRGVSGPGHDPCLGAGRRGRKA